MCIRDRIEGISIDATNAANLRRRVNRTLMIQSAEQSVTIDGPDLDMVWRYAGYCRADHETCLLYTSHRLYNGLRIFETHTGEGVP